MKYGIFVCYTDTCEPCRQSIIMHYLGVKEWEEDYDDIWDLLQDRNDNDNNNNNNNNENNNNGNNNNGNNNGNNGNDNNNGNTNN